MFIYFATFAQKRTGDFQNLNTSRTIENHVKDLQNTEQHKKYIEWMKLVAIFHKTILDKHIYGMESSKHRKYFSGKHKINNSSSNFVDQITCKWQY